MNGSQGREEWARLITKAKLLTAMTREELFAEATSVYDNYVEALETPRSPRPLLISG
jgi:rsbT co-antagonist protein RsbR